MKRVAVLTSGGDAPGMNAAIRAVVRVGSARGAEVVGVRQGYSGLLGGQLQQPLGARDVAGIIHTGGTMLGSDRSTEFRTPAGLERARRVLSDHHIDGIVIIGGNGSLSGAHALSNTGFPVVGVASTIDNDVNGADITIGVDTALNIALEAIDRLKTTASSHQRAFVVEVMGRDHGYLALMAGKWKPTPTPCPARCGAPTPGASATPWWWWRRARAGTPPRWSGTSPSTANSSASSCGPRFWDTCNEAALRVRSTACWPVARPPRPWIACSRAKPGSSLRW
jgi:hypothetical protein